MEYEFIYEGAKTMTIQPALQSLKRTLPPFRADHVGSLLRPERLKKARLDKENGIISADQLTAIENEEIRRIVEKQKEAGVLAITDGEFRRSWWHFDFLEGLTGIEGFDKEHGLKFHHIETRGHGIRVTEKIDFPDDHPFLEHFKFLKEAIGENEDGFIAKQTIPSLSLLSRPTIINRDIYPDLDEYYDDLAKAYKKAVHAFYHLGCRYLQIDDTNWGFLADPKNREALKGTESDAEDVARRCAQALNKALEDKPADLIVTMHICRGNYASSWAFSGGYEPVAEILFNQINVDGYFLEYDSERSGDFKPLRFVTRKDLHIVLGLITSKSAELEDIENIKARIQEASQFVPLEQLALSPQCGFASTEEGNLLTEEEQWEKLKWVKKIADDVWK